MSVARCKVTGCRRKAHARGLCQKHYDEERKARPAGRTGAGASARSSGRGREPAPAFRRPAAPPEDGADDAASKMCSVPGCASAHHAKGYCKMHYGQLRRRGRIEEAPVAEVGDATSLSMEQRLVEIKKRHELLKREIASIHKALESESDDDSED